MLHFFSMLNLNWSVFVITLLTIFQNNKQFLLSPNGKLYELNEHSSCNWSKSDWNQNVHCKKLMSNRKQKDYTIIQDNAFNAKVAYVVQCELWFEYELALQHLSIHVWKPYRSICLGKCNKCDKPSFFFSLIWTWMLSGTRLITKYLRTFLLIRDLFCA